MTPEQVPVRIVADTTAGLPQEFLREHPIEVVPQVILFGEESLLEEVQISYPEFVRRLKASSELPKTAAPPPGEYVKSYGREVGRARCLLTIAPSSDVSGTVRSAMTAKEESFPTADIRILDTRTVGGNLATMVQLAVGWAEEGAGPDDILARLQAMIPRGRTYFLVATLEYLRRGGRIGGASALVGGALQIKPILELKDGHVDVVEKVRTEHRALERLKELVERDCPRGPEGHLCVMHADDREAAEALAADLRTRLGLTTIPIYTLGAAITTHAGPGALGVGFFTAA
jgi:DegV family protein with EDD domain